MTSTVDVAKARAPLVGPRLKLRVIWTLIQRDILISFRVSRAGYLLTMLEPVFQFLMMFAVFTGIHRQPGFGTSLGVFLATGIVPYFMFMHLSSRVMWAIRGARSFARVTTVRPFDLALAKGLLEYVTLIIFAMIVFTLLAYIGEGTVPRHPEVLVQAVLMLGVLGFGIGMVNGVLAHVFKFYALAYSIVARSMLFFSGVFYVPAQLPASAREFLFLNPLMHGVEWFRTGIFENYPAFDLNHGYLGIWALGSFSLGVVMVTAAHGRLAR